MHNRTHYYARICIYIAFACIVFAGCPHGVFQEPQQDGGRSSASPLPQITAQSILAHQEGLTGLSNKTATVREGYSIVKTRDSFDPAEFKNRGGTVEAAFRSSDSRYFLVHTPGNAKEFRDSVRACSGVIYAQPDYCSQLPQVSKETGYDAQMPPVLHPHTASSSTAVPFATHEGTVSEDPKAHMFDWGLTVTHALEAFKQYDSHAKHPVIAAVIDTGVNSLHEDFSDSEGKSIILYAKSTLVKGKANEFREPTVIPLTENWDNVGHGTHCAGTIAAVGNNGKGICGVAHANTALITYRGIDINGASEFATYSCLGDLAAIITELRKEPQNRNHSVLKDLPASVRNLPKIEQTTIPVNMSLGGGFINLYEIEMTNKALAAGILPIIAMGNDGKTIAAFPAANQGVLAVGATTMYDKRASFSNGGAWMSVCAPGKSIFSCSNGGDDWYKNYSPALKQSYAWLSGTSMATPFVTGTAAYLLSLNPHLTPYQLKTILEQSADKIDTDDSEYGRYDSRGHSKWYGYGRVNVLKAAKMVVEGTIPAVGSVYSEKAVTITVQKNGRPLSDKQVWVHEKSGYYVSAGITNRDGSVDFRGLRANTDYDISVPDGDSYRSITIRSDTNTDRRYTIEL